MDRTLPRRLSLLGCLVVLVVAGLSALPHSNWWWGVNALHFLPFPAQVAVPMATVLALLALGWVSPRARSNPAPGTPAPEATSAPLRTAAGFFGSPLRTGIVAGLLALPLLHLLRARHVLLGDGSTILARLALGQPLETRSAPFDLIEPTVVALVQSWRGPGVSLTRAGFLSTLVGALTVGLVARQLAQRARAGRWTSARLLAPLLLLQPAMQLFCGYVETYSLLASALILYFLLLDESAGGQRGPQGPVLAAIAAFAAHPLGVLAWPGLAGLRRSAGRRWPWLVAPPALLAILFALFRIPGVSTGALRWMDPLLAIEMGRAIVQERLSGAAGFQFLARPSLLQAADWANQAALSATPALVLLGALALGRNGRRGFLAPGALAVLGGTIGFVALRALLRTPLGAPRDWDLFAPMGIGLTAWAGAVLASVVDDPGEPVGADASAGAGVAAAGRGGLTGRLVGQLTILGLFCTGPWLALQIMPAWAVDRHISILEGRPRSEAIVQAAGHRVMGDRFTGMGQSFLAAQAYRAAYRVHPEFESAWRSGLAYLACGRVEEAGGAFQECSRLRPRDWRVWNELGNALTGLGQFAMADSALRRSIALNPEAADPRIHLSRSLAMQGFEEEARAMLESARPRLDPKSAVAKDFRKLDENIRPALK